MTSTLISRNVVVNGHRTSMRLEQEMWDAMSDICRLERRSMHELCTLIESRRRKSSLTSAVRVFVLNYYRSMTQVLEDGSQASMLAAPRPTKDQVLSLALDA